jgi:hypothetical protein
MLQLLEQERPAVFTSRRLGRRLGTCLRHQRELSTPLDPRVWAGFNGRQRARWRVAASGQQVDGGSAASGAGNLGLAGDNRDKPSVTTVSY